VFIEHVAAADRPRHRPTPRCLNAHMGERVGARAKGPVSWGPLTVSTPGEVGDPTRMLIQDFVQVKAPYASVRDRLLDKSPRWLTDGATAAYAEGERLFLTISATGGEVTVRKRVQVDLGAAYVRGEGLVVPLSWWATGAQRLFPTLDADLELMPLGPDQVMLTLMGRYEPPLGAVGRGLDRLVLHRIAETCVRSFLHRTAANLELAIAA
jgi:hypothetical protein